MAATEVDTAALRDLIAEPKLLNVEGVPHIVLPENYKLESLERLLDRPRRIERLVVAHDVRGFTDYVNKFKCAETALFCGAQTTPKLVAVVDDHLPGQPSKGTHRVSFDCPRTLEWNTWYGNNKKVMAQLPFAEFIENQLRDIIEPNGADMLSMVLNFRDLGSADFKSALRLGDGRIQFQFIEKDEQTEARFPEVLKIAIPVFEGVRFAYPMTAKLRYRTHKEDGLTLWYELDRPDLTLRQAYEDLLDSVEKDVAVSIIRAL